MMLTILCHHLRGKGKELRIIGIDSDTHPMGIGPAEGLDPGEILERPITGQVLF